MKKLLIVFIAFLCIPISSFLCQDAAFKQAHESLIKVDSKKNEIEFMHFKFSFLPRFEKGTFYDLFYGISYKEIGTSQWVDWVNKYSGQLINVGDLKKQSKGYFIGLRGIRYLFYFELKDDKQSPTGSSILIKIFSTDPEMDQKYIENFGKAPFKVDVNYYSLKPVRDAISVYGYVSSIKAAYQIASSSNPEILIAGAIGEAIFSYIIKNEIKDIPINIKLTCNVCGREKIIPIREFKSFIYQCETEGCKNRGKIIIE